MKLIILLVSLLSFSMAYSQSITDMEKKLSGLTQKSWKMAGNPVEFYGDSCVSGLQYSFFYKGKRARKIQCIDGHSTTQSITWGIAQNQQDFMLTLSNGEQYQIQFIMKDNKRQLRLRSFNPKIVEKTVDIYFDPI